MIIIRRKSASSIPFHVGLGNGNGEFILFDKMEDYVSGDIELTERFLELSYGEILAAVKNALLYWNKGFIDFDTENGTERWRLHLNPLNAAARDSYTQNLNSKTKEPPR